MDKSGRNSLKNRLLGGARKEFLHDKKQELHGLKSLLHDAKWEEKE